MPLFYHMERFWTPHKLRMSLFESSIYTRVPSSTGMSGLRMKNRHNGSWIKKDPNRLFSKILMKLN